MTKKRVLSGIRASGKLHLGNYLGAVQGMIALQDDPEYETFYMVADLHSMTTPFEPKEIRNNVNDVVLDYLSAGLDPEKSTIFIQSEVSQHTELFYLLSTSVTVARMQHLPTFKDRVKQFPDNVTMALLNYPVLMAADILTYKADSVPVGDDQLPHLEIAREIARKMNDNYGLNFPEPIQFKTEGHHVSSLTGEGKMSKSVEGSYIQLTDDLETIKKRLASVPSDSGKGKIVASSKKQVSRDKKYISENGGESLGVGTLMALIEIFQGKEKRKEYEKQYQESGIKYQALKEELAEAIYNELKPIQERRKVFENDPERVEKIIKDGAEKAREVAEETVKEVKEKMGLL